MSKIDKIRNKLSSIQKKGREDFERQKKILEDEMNIGRSNMSKIQKRLKKDALDGNETLQLDTSAPQFISDGLSSPSNAHSPLERQMTKKLSKIGKHGSFSNQGFQNLLSNNQTNSSQANQAAGGGSGSNIFFDAIAQKNIPGIITMASQILPSGTRISVR